METTRNARQGRFITFEGTEGAGKTTQIRLLKEYLDSLNLDALVTREPGGTEVGEQVRNLLLQHTSLAMHASSELLLMFAARAQHLAEIIFPALQAGTWVICDRFTDASYAYQGGGRGIPAAQIRAIENAVHEGFQPDLTVLLTCAPETAMRRVGDRDEEKDRFESESQEFFMRVHAAYLKRVEQDRERFAVIDTEAKIEDVAAAVRQAVASRFSL